MKTFLQPQRDRTLLRCCLRATGITFMMLILTIAFLPKWSIAQSAQRPFPQHTPYINGSIKPNTLSQSALDDSVRSFYNRWKAVYLLPACSPNQYYISGGTEIASGIGVSEGQGYGILITAFMAGYDPNAKIYFDGLYNYYRAHPSENNHDLMAWKQLTGCVSSADSNSATDGDLDIAYSLLLADKQWGSGGSINYRQAAIRIIDAIKIDEINPNTSAVKLGDWAIPSDVMYNDTRSSDFLMNHFRAFEFASGDTTWKNALNRCYTLVDAMQTNFSPTTGLIPDFIRHVNTTPAPANPNFLESPYDGHYYYNACRDPFRIGVDYLLTGDPRALTALTKINTFIRAKTGNNPENIRAGYRLNGTAIDTFDVSMAFIAPFAVGAMIDSSNQSWLNALWRTVDTTSFTSNDYYGNTLKMLTMIVLSGNWWNPQTSPLYYYVAQQGNDNNPGTEALPWKTIQKACDAALPGSTVLIKGGVYNEKVIVNVSGDSVNGYITFTHFGNDTVIIDGTGKSGDQVILIQNKKYIKIIGMELQNNLNQTFGTGIWVQGFGDHIELRNNRIHDMKAAPGGGDAMGISIYGSNNVPLSHIVIDGNQIYNCQPGHSEALTLNGNVDTFQVTNNLVHDVDNIGIDMIGGEGTCPTPVNDVARNGVCSRNIVYRARSNYGGGYAAGVYVDGGKNILVERNIVYQCDVGMEIGCENQGRIASGMIVRENLLFNNDKRGLSFGGYNYPLTGQVTDSRFSNNTCYQNDVLNTDAGELVIEYARNCIVENNIFFGTTQNKLMTTSFPNNAGNVINYNLWYLNGGSSVASIDYNGTVYSSFSSYLVGSGQDGNSQFSNPMFISAGLPFPDLHLQASSSAINTGNPAFVSGVGEADFDGNYRIKGARVDIGAYENTLVIISSPQLVSPLNGAIIQTPPIVVLWNTSAGAIQYQLQVSRDSSFTTIVVNDSLLTDTTKQLGSLLNYTTYHWRVRAINAADVSLWSDVRKFMYANPARWKMVSVPNIVIDARTTVVYPTALTNAFTYIHGSGYVIKDTLEHGTGYWIKFGIDQTINTQGDSLLTDTINIVEGWNMIGSISIPVDVHSIVSIPSNITTSSFFGYATSYVVADSIMPGRGYWVKATQSAKLVLSNSNSVVSGNRITIAYSQELPPSPPDGERSSVSVIPPAFNLYQNYPNPFNPVTDIRYQITEAGYVSLNIYDVMGREIAVLVQQELFPGTYHVTWTAVNVASGVYYLQLRNGRHTAIRNMMYVK